jgi:hypothetical protein
MDFKELFDNLENYENILKKINTIINKQNLNSFFDAIELEEILNKIKNKKNEFKYNFRIIFLFLF